MAFPTGWPPRPASNTRSIRFFVGVTSTQVFSDRAYIFEQQAGANPFQETPKIDHGDVHTVAEVGDDSAGGVPMGGGDLTADNPTEPMIWSGTIRICNDGAVFPLEFSFDGTKIDGRVLPTESLLFRHRHEAGIAVRGVGGNTAFRVMAW